MNPNGIKLTASEIVRIIVGRSNRFSLRGSNVFFLMENVSWGLFNWGEVDLLVCSKALYLTDIEVKVSISDLNADFQKKKWDETHRKGKSFLKDIKHHYYAIPKELVDRAVPIIEEFRPNSGIIIVNKVLRDGLSKHYAEFCQVKKTAKANSKAKPMKPNSIINLARLAMFRYWRF
jgi:hypothetical protein